MKAVHSRAWAEILAVVATGGLFLLFENVLHVKLAFLIPCILLWTGYFVWRIRRERALVAEWGIRVDNLSVAAPPCLAFFAIAVIGLVIIRLSLGWRALPPGAAWIFLLYPVWAFIQQFVVQALISLNLERLGVSRVVIVPVAALLFGLAHIPDWPLAALCAGAGLVWTILFLRWRNLPVLAFSHAWLGALVYYWVLERDPWLELFPK